MSQTTIAVLFLLLNGWSAVSIARSQGNRSSLKSALGAAAATILSLVPGMGLPGGFGLLLGDLWFRLLLGTSVDELFAGDRMWPAAIFVTLLMGAMIVPVLALTHLLWASDSNGKRRAKGFALWLVWVSLCPLILGLLELWGLA